MIPHAFIQDLLARADVVDVVGRHVQLKKAGINFKGLCPFHGEKTPSFIVSPTRQTYHCFGCSAHGNAIGFLMEHAGLGFIDAVHDLAQQMGVAVPEDDTTPEERARAAQQRERQATLTEVLARAAAHYRQQLKGSERAVAYLKGRGLTGEIAARFGMGYAPPAWRGLASVYPAYDDPQLVEAGLVIVQEATEAGGAAAGSAAAPDTARDAAREKRYDRFRDRIMFPIRNVKGEVIGFGGRVLDSGEPKYLNSPETPVFVKGRELYGLFESRTALREKGYALVTEGYMDVVALAQLGFANAVATLGTACTADHVQKLLRFTDHVVFSFDGDAAGRRAAGRALEAALPHADDTRQFRFLFLPAEHDPDSFIRAHGSAGFEAEVARAVPLSRQLVETAALECDLTTPEGRSKMLAQARPMVEQMPDGLLREQLLAELAQRGGVSLEVLTSHWARAQGRGPRGGDAGGRDAPEGGSGRQGRARGSAASAPRRAPPRTATLLDRAAWLLVRHAALGERLGGDDLALLAEQPPPYGVFFAALERSLHEHGPLPMASLLEDLGAGAEAPVWAALIDRLRQFHEVDDAASAATDLQAVLLMLHQQAVNDELTLLMESGGDLSAPAQARRGELMSAATELRARIEAAQKAQNDASAGRRA